MALMNMNPFLYTLFIFVCFILKFLKKMKTYQCNLSILPGCIR